MPRKQPSATPVAAPTLLHSSIHTRQSLSCHASLFQPTDFSHLLIVNNPPAPSEARSLARSLSHSLRAVANRNAYPGPRLSLHQKRHKWPGHRLGIGNNLQMPWALRIM